MKLNHLTDKTLLHETFSLVQREREILADILWRLKEIDQRKLYADLKCSSLFDYCVKVLKYSEGQASRRVLASRLLREMPELSDFIQRGEVNLTQLNMVKQFFNEMGELSPIEKRTLIEEIKGKTIRETEKILWDKKDPDQPLKKALLLEADIVAALYELRAKRAHSCPDMNSLMNELLELAHQEWDPTVVKRERARGQGKSRYVQVGVKAEVFKRDQGRCKNCGSVCAIEIDHIHPYSMGGSTTVENLRLLCRNCNQRQGQRRFSKNSMPFTTASSEKTKAEAWPHQTME